MSTESISARRAATQLRLMDAAVGLFAERGVLASSVEEICERAGFTRGAFYSNFDSKDDLCLAVLQRQADESLAAAERAIATLPAEGWAADDVDGLIELAVATFVRSQPTDRAALLAHIELRLHAARNPAVRPAFNALYDRVAGLISGLLGQALGRVGARLSAPLDQAIDMLHAIYEHGALTAMTEGRESVDEVRTQQLVGALRALVQPA